MVIILSVKEIGKYRYVALSCQDQTPVKKVISSTGVVLSDTWQIYTWKHELACHSKRVTQHFRELMDDDYDGPDAPFHMLERALTLSGFVMRRMMERKLVTDLLQAQKISIRTINNPNKEEFSEPWISDTGPRGAFQYDFSNPDEIELSIKNFGDEIVHASQIAIAYNFCGIEDGILIASDWHNKKRLLHVTPAEYELIVAMILDDEIKSSVDGYGADGKVFSRRERR